MPIRHYKPTGIELGGQHHCGSTTADVTRKGWLLAVVACACPRLFDESCSVMSRSPLELGWRIHHLHNYKNASQDKRAAAFC